MWRFRAGDLRSLSCQDHKQCYYENIAMALCFKTTQMMVSRERNKITLILNVKVWRVKWEGMRIYLHDTENIGQDLPKRWR